MSLQDQHHRLLTICPPEIRRIILRDFDEDDFVDYKSLKQEILDRVNQELEDVQGKPAINGVEERKEGEGHTEEHQEEWKEEWNYPEVNGVKGKGKGKGKKGDGKGKGKPFEGECFNCLEKKATGQPNARTRRTHS